MEVETQSSKGTGGALTGLLGKSFKLGGQSVLRQPFVALGRLNLGHDFIDKLALFLERSTLEANCRVPKPILLSDELSLHLLVF